jgi:hypothetical protein
MPDQKRQERPLSDQKKNSSKGYSSSPKTDFCVGEDDEMRVDDFDVKRKIVTA